MGSEDFIVVADRKGNEAVVDADLPVVPQFTNKLRREFPPARKLFDMLLSKCRIALLPIERWRQCRMRCRSVDAGHFQIPLHRIAPRKVLVQFEEINLVALAASRETFEAEFAAAVFVHGKGIVLVIVKRTARAFLRVLAES